MFLNISDNFLPQTLVEVTYGPGNTNAAIKVQLDNNANSSLIWDSGCTSLLATGTNKSCGTAPTNVGCFSSDNGALAATTLTDWHMAGFIVNGNTYSNPDISFYNVGKTETQSTFNDFVQATQISNDTLSLNRNYTK